jgi:hypothetical protein
VPCVSCVCLVPVVPNRYCVVVLHWQDRKTLARLKEKGYKFEVGQTGKGVKCRKAMDLREDGKLGAFTQQLIKEVKALLDYRLGSQWMLHSNHSYQDIKHCQRHCVCC